MTVRELRHRIDNSWKRYQRSDLAGGMLAHDWSDSNTPWAYSSANDWEQRLPSSVPVVSLSTNGATFWDKLNNTVNAQSGRFICRLPAGVFTLTSFRLIGNSGDPSYSFGFWFPKLAGFVGAGPDQTFVEMAANSMTQAQLDKLSTMTQASYAPNQMGLCRIDSSETDPGYLGGLTFRADNQNPLTQISNDITGNIVVPQPAPHQGPLLYSNTVGLMTVSHVRFQGAGKAWMSQPPFEMANITSQRCRITWYRCEFDGRLSPVFNSSRPRKCGTWMGNNEKESHMTECWFHHSNVSRYAANDQNNGTPGIYELVRCKANQITNTQNDGNGGYTNATPFGWESTAAELRVTDCIIEQNNPYTNQQIAQHLQVTSVGGVDPSGGRMYVKGGIYRNSGFPGLDGYLCLRLTPSQWVNSGYANTIFVYENSDGSGIRKQPYVYSGSWPPSSSTLSGAGVSPATHYLVRNS